MERENPDPRGGVRRRRLHLFVLADCSRSMVGRMEALNDSLGGCAREIARLDRESALAELRVAVAAFSRGASWHVPPGTAGAELVWADLAAEGLATDFGGALGLLAGALTPEALGRCNLPPVVLVISDGAATDNWEAELARLDASSWGKPGRTLRLALAVGQAADRELLKRVTGDPQAVWPVGDAAQLAHLVRWALVTLPSRLAAGVSPVGGRGERSPDLTLPPPVPRGTGAW